MSDSLYNLDRAYRNGKRDGLARAAELVEQWGDKLMQEGKNVEDFSVGLAYRDAANAIRTESSE